MLQRQRRNLCPCPLSYKYQELDADAQLHAQKDRELEALRLQVDDLKGRLEALTVAKQNLETRLHCAAEEKVAFSKWRCPVARPMFEGGHRKGAPPLPKGRDGFVCPGPSLEKRRRQTRKAHGLPVHLFELLLEGAPSCCP